MSDIPKRGPGRPRTRDKARALRVDDPIESLPPTARNLLDAARRILVRDGFTSLSLSAIAAEADESKASIGYHFGNKEGLVVALVDSLVHEANRSIISETHRYPMGEQRLRALMDGEKRIVDDTDSFVALMEILPHAMRDGSLRSRVADLYADYRATVLDVLSAQDDPSHAELASLATLMIALVDGLSVQHSLDPDRANVAAAIALWEKMMRCVLRDLRMIDVG